MNRTLLSAIFEFQNKEYTIATTHFTWTPNGYPNALQEHDLELLLDVLSDYPELILCGDLNAPRGMAIFEIMKGMYRDNIPKQYLSSLDPKLHRTKGTRELMVDGLFSTPHYRFPDVKLEFGVSDHAAIVSHVERTSEHIILQT